MKRQKSASCKNCSKKFMVYLSRKSVSYCSIMCKQIDYKTWHPIINKKFIPQKKEKIKKKRFKWREASEEQKIDRLTKYFNKHAIKKEGCWDWNGVLHGSGYASLNFGENYKNLAAHRASWMIHRGNLPENLFVLHNCDNKKCTNPEHLSLGTAKDNTLDMISKNRSNPRKGESHPHTKLTTEQVKEIKKLLKLGVTMTRISKDFNISKGALSALKSGVTWKHITVD